MAASGSNVALPDPVVPNNLMAAWWTDLDLTSAGNWYAASVNDGTNDYTVFEWEDVPRFGNPAETATFQIWIQDGTDQIWFAYDHVDGSDGTVGAEDDTGTSGVSYYHDGTGTLPGSANDLVVEQFISPPAVFNFQVTATGDPGATIMNVVNASDGTAEYAAVATTDIQGYQEYFPVVFK